MAAAARKVKEGKNGKNEGHDSKYSFITNMATPGQKRTVLPIFVGPRLSQTQFSI